VDLVDDAIKTTTPLRAYERINKELIDGSVEDPKATPHLSIHSTAMA
jgi:hypothetical protein